MNRKHVVLYCILTILAVVFVFNFASAIGGTWVELDAIGDEGCNVFQHVMCSEYSSDLSQYNPITKLIPYNTLTSDKSNKFCVIKLNAGVRGAGFGYIQNYSTLTEVKDNRVILADLQCTPVSYGGPVQHYDEQCMADEFFPNRHPNGSLDLRTYVENGKEYRVQYTQGNVDNFNVISGQCGTYIWGSVVDDETNLPVYNASVTLFFKSDAGVSEYFTFYTDIYGRYETLLERDITTYYGTYENVSLIPITTYIIAVKHPLYQDDVSDAQAVYEPLEHNVRLKKGTVCSPECTYVGGSICRQECEGINGCQFPRMDGVNLSTLLHGVPKNNLFTFTYNETNYGVNACIGDVFEIQDTPIGAQATCEPGTNVWKTTRLVRLNGQLVRMILTVCE